MNIICCKQLTKDLIFEVCSTVFVVIIQLPSVDIGSRALALADPYCHIAWNSVGLWVCPQL